MTDKANRRETPAAAWRLDSASPSYADMRRAVVGIIGEAICEHGPPDELSVAWPEGSEADRARLAADLSGEFGFPVEIVASPEDAASEAGRQAIEEARRARLAGQA